MTDASDDSGSNDAAGDRQNTPEGDDRRDGPGDDDRHNAPGDDDRQNAPENAPDRPASAGPGEMTAALREIRREGWKASFLQSLVDATALFLGVNLLLTTLEPAWLPTRVRLPDSVADSVSGVVEWHVGSLAVPGSATVAGVVGMVALVAGLVIRARRPLVEQFEAANPPVAEALRTARDAVDDDADTRMARRLYGRVLQQLRESSSLGLVNGTRVGVTVLVVVVLSLATLQAAALDLALLDRSPLETDETDDERVENYSGLQDPEGILGAREEVSAGEDEMQARVDSTGGGRDVEEDRQFPSDRTGTGSDGSGSGVDGQQAGFADPERVEDAELVREYNRRIRETNADEADGSDADDGAE